MKIYAEYNRKKLIIESFKANNFPIFYLKK